MDITIKFSSDMYGGQLSGHWSVIFLFLVASDGEHSELTFEAIFARANIFPLFLNFFEIGEPSVLECFFEAYSLLPVFL